MENKSIKSGPQIVKDFITEMGKDQDLDPGVIKILEELVISDGKVSAAKLLRELERLRRE
ncbi:MAG: hypothetical protein C4293_17960 [Nitrospiraceae bacterium]